MSLTQYPQLRELQPGEKVWIGGVIKAVDPTGTGTVYLQAEHLSFGDEPPVIQLKQPNPEKREVSRDK